MMVRRASTVYLFLALKNLQKIKLHGNFLLIVKIPFNQWMSLTLKKYCTYLTNTLLT